MFMIAVGGFRATIGGMLTGYQMHVTKPADARQLIVTAVTLARK
jgi:hypothetical protein